MTNAERILDALDARLQSAVELTLYGRAALQLGFEQALPEHAMSRDVDAVLWMGQAEFLNETTDFWRAVDALNADFADQELYISHFFTEDQVILRPDWREHRVRIEGPWRRLSIYRLGDLDLLLSKLMRDDPIDREDALFIVRSARLSREAIEEALDAARIPEVPDIREQFALAVSKLRDAIAPGGCALSSATSRAGRP